MASSEIYIYNHQTVIIL